MLINWLPSIIIRLVVPLTIFKLPFWGSILSVFADVIDVVIWDFLSAPNLSTYYNFVDKLLDSYFLIIQGVLVLKWKNDIAKKTGIFLLIYRVLGVIVYEITKYRFLLFVFPNLFLWYFLFYTGVKKFVHKDIIKNTKSNILAIIFLLIPKLLQEYVMHVVEFNIFRYLQNLF